MSPGQRGRRGPGSGALRGLLRALRLLSALLLAAAASAGEEPAEAVPTGDEASAPRLAEQVTVTAARSDVRVGDTPASVAVLPRAALDVTAAPTIDDALRQVVGFGLFRRTGSQTANPTVQGVSLRGLGASGASRSLVLLDGLPLNDPFGGWVYWGRAPMLAVERLEVLRGGSSDLYGSGALGGVAQILTRPAGPGRGLRAEASAGGAGFLEGAFTAHGSGPKWGGRVSAQALHTDGYLAVDPWERGSVDRPVASRHAALDTTVERRLGGGGRAFVRGMYYDEARENGTPLQENDTWIGLLAGGYDRGPWSVRLWGSSQELRQTFTAVSADRDSERLTRSQRVPADALGASAQWGRALGGRHRLVAGVEGRVVRGTTHETGYFGGSAASRLEAGGEQRSGAVFVADHLQLHPKWLLTAAGRFDVWAQRDGQSSVTPLVPQVAASEMVFPTRSATAFSPRLGLLFRAAPSLSFAASAYGAFRAPTLNELYRGFRVGGTVTLANPALDAERLRGGEVGALWTAGPFALRATLFDAEVRDAVANVTLEVSEALVTRQRQNLARSRSRGLELEGELILGSRGALVAGYTLIDSTVSDFPPDPVLEGRQLPHIPRHQAVLQARYTSDWRLGLQARWIGEAYEDDRNTLVLDSAFVLDLFVAREVAGGLELFAAGENLFDASMVVGRTPVRRLGAPRSIRVGVRFSSASE